MWSWKWGARGGVGKFQGSISAILLRVTSLDWFICREELGRARLRLVEVRRPGEEERMKGRKKKRSERGKKSRRKERKIRERKERPGRFLVSFRECLEADGKRKRETERETCSATRIPRNILLERRIYVRVQSTGSPPPPPPSRFTINLLHPFGRNCQSRPIKNHQSSCGD